MRQSTRHHVLNFLALGYGSLNQGKEKVHGSPLKGKLKETRISIMG